jgi:hypothetical protein
VYQFRDLRPGAGVGLGFDDAKAITRRFIRDS